MLFYTRLFAVLLCSMLALTTLAAPVATANGLHQREASLPLFARLAALVEPRGTSRGGNKRDAMPGTSRGGNKRDAMPGTSRGGNKRDAMPGTSRGGNKRDAMPGTSRGGNKRDAMPGTSRGGN